MALTADDIDFFRRACLRHPIALALDDLPSLKPSDRCKLLAMALMKTGDRDLLQKARDSGLLERLKAETLMRKSQDESSQSAGYAHSAAALQRLMALARQPG